jgi:hypothetical protein
MSRVRRSAFASCAVAGLVLVGASPAIPAAREPARLQVTAREFSFVLSRGALRAGPAVVQLVNLGEDDHDLALRRVGRSATTRRSPVTRPGRLSELELRLRAGRYRLWCTLLDHRARGMRATLIVR